MVPIPLIVTSPLALSTVATAVLPDLNDTVPSVFFVSVFVNGASIFFFVTEALANFKSGDAFAIVNVFLADPVYPPLPVTVTLAVPASTLFA